MNHSLFRPLTVAVALAAAALANARAAFNYTETFSLDNNPAGWTQLALADSDSLAQNPLTGRLDFSAQNFGLLFLIADEGASLGAFTGDYATPAISALRFHLDLDAGSTVTELYAELTNFTEDETWHFTLTPVAAGTGATFLVPIDSAGTGWTQVSGDQPFTTVLNHVESFAIIFSNSTGSGNLSGSIDNVAAVPEPASAVLGGFGALFLLRRRRHS